VWNCTEKNDQRFAGKESTLKTRVKLFACQALILGMVVTQSYAQQTPPQGNAPKPPASTSPQPAPKSPEVDKAGMVTFRIYAPAATEVKVQAEGNEATPGMTSEKMNANPGGIPMIKAGNGVWSYTLGPIQPGVYSYNFVVDGAAVADPRNPASSETLNAVKSMYEVPGAAFLEYGKDVPHGAIAVVRYPSAVLNELRRMHVYTPPGYEGDAKRYPVLYLLHGGGDSDDSWATIGRAGAILDNLIAEHKAVPMMIVMPAGHISRTMSFDLNTMGHDKFNADLTDSIVPFVDQLYRTLADRQNRAIAGLSMGGLQTLTISLTRSDLFAYVGIFSSGWFPQTREQVERTDLATYKSSGKPFALYWVNVGKLDIAYENSNSSVELLKKYGIKPDTHTSEGFHAWNNWREYLRTFAPLLFRAEQ